MPRIFWTSSATPTQHRSDEDGSDWVTVKALGAPGADWSVQTARHFAAEWSRRLDVEPLFERDLENMEKEIEED